ncbi:hypothetical protein CNYM01_05026 [Colletotrichum nymphaeae SA-01]|uniref:Uncharacterized protein n=1 Tax=Colletotrichum nymphaeae SA-01 TaxID=1460502 RepID=A0A135TDP2_9PEZI|nr:hypothetical protein CNYM01_05026 [Colletotrichum nymphaeae SA-01]
MACCGAIAKKDFVALPSWRVESTRHRDEGDNSLPSEAPSNPPHALPTMWAILFDKKPGLWSSSSALASGAPGLSIALEPPNRAAIVLCLRDDQAATVAPLLSVRDDSST